MSITIIGTRTRTLGFLSAKAGPGSMKISLTIASLSYFNIAACLIIHSNGFFTKQRLNMGSCSSWQLLKSLFHQQKFTKNSPHLRQFKLRFEQKRFFLKFVWGLFWILNITLSSKLGRKDYKFNLCSQILKLGRRIFSE